MRPRQTRRPHRNRHSRPSRPPILTPHHEIHAPENARAGTVILSAGLGGAGAYWHPQLQSLTQHVQVITYDQRGTGQSQQPLPSPYAMTDMANDVLQILDTTATPTCHFIGHALGALIGLQLAQTHPTRIQTLTLINAWARLDSHTARCFQVRLDLLRHAGPEAYIRAQPIFLFPALWLSEHADRLAQEHTQALAHFQGTENLERRIAALQAFDATPNLQSITHPTLVAAARDDILVPYTASEYLANHLPNARLWLAQEGGHAINVTHPTSFNAELTAFLTHPRHRRA